MIAAIFLMSGCGEGSIPIPKGGDVASHEVNFPNGHEVDLGNPSAYKPMEKNLNRPPAPLLKKTESPSLLPGGSEEKKRKD